MVGTDLGSLHVLAHFFLITPCEEMEGHREFLNILW